MNELIEQLEALLCTAQKLNEEMVNAYAENAYLRYVKKCLEQENRKLIEELKDREQEICDCEAELRDCVVNGDCNVYR